MSSTQHPQGPADPASDQTEVEADAPHSPSANIGPDADTLRLPDEDETAALSFLHPPLNDDSLGLIADYPVERALGRGAMGIVLKAFDPSLHRAVAIKVLSPELAASTTFRQRFLREARAAAAINHPNVVTIHAVGEHRGLPYLVMEYIAGRTLAQRLRVAPPLEVADMLRIGVQLADGLEAAHRHGLVHRDIKPSNIMLEDSIERVKLTDFGLARAAMEPSELTSLGRIVGTPAYMSPEQIDGRRVDARSDLFALGCVFHAMATGDSPFHGGHALEIIRRIHDTTPPPLATVAPHIPEGLSQLVGRLLEREPGHRYATAGQVSAELSRMLVELRESSSSIRRTIPPASAADNRKRRRWGLPAVAVGVPLLALGIWFGLLRKPTPPPAPPQPAPVAPPAVPILTVARAGAQFTTLEVALEHARPGMEIRVLDDGTYDGPWRIHRADRWAGLTITSPHHATLRAPGAKQVLVIANTPGVTVDGLRIVTETEQFGIALHGAVEGTTLRHLHVAAPDAAKWAAVYLADAAAGTAERPVAVLDSTFHIGGLGIILRGSAERPVRFVRIAGNRFLGEGTHVQLLSAVRHVTIAANAFAGGKGISLMLTDPAASRDITIARNTFMRTRYWLNLATTDPAVDGVALRDNLIIGGDIESPTRSPADFTDHWTIRGNWWQPAPGADDRRMRLLAERHENVPLRSVDPDHPEYLVPAEEAAPGIPRTGGERSDPVGAGPPRGRLPRPAPAPPKAAP